MLNKTHIVLTIGQSIKNRPDVRPVFFSINVEIVQREHNTEIK
jgi:hypothetical protein